jgi:hypothetical protein
VEGGLLLARGKRAFAIVLTIALQNYAFCSDSGAMLQATGDVQVNGTAVPSSFTISGGDSIDVGPNSSASLRTTGTSVSTAANTKIQWINENEITLNEGGVFVNTVPNLKTNLGNCGAVMPIQSPENISANSYTKYEVKIQGDKAYVYARELPVTVKTDTQTIELKPAKVAMVSSIRASKCKIAYFDTVNDAVANGLIIGGFAATSVLLLTLPYDSPGVSAFCPDVSCQN